MAAGTIIAAVLFILGEITTRAFTNVTFQGNSANLITAGRFGGRTWGNTPDVTAQSFEAPVYTDHNGFRVPHTGYKYPDPASEQILILGDSVAFGPGVVEPNTFVGLLRSAHPDWAVYNSSVIAYDATNYADVVAKLIAKPRKFTKVILIYCLNDVSAASAIDIDGHIEQVESAAALDSRKVSSDGSTASGLVERLRHVGLIFRMNDFLRAHSKLYLYLKGISTDPAKRYFLADYAAYRDIGAISKLDKLEFISRTFGQQQTEFTVIISPYAYQLRAGATLPSVPDGDLFLPQRVVTKFLQSKGIAYVDATVAFMRARVSDKSRLFLRFDPMHFSVAGHRVMYDVVRSVADHARVSGIDSASPTAMP